MKQQKKVAELLLWTVLAIILGLVISFAAAWCKSGRISQDHAFRNVCR